MCPLCMTTALLVAGSVAAAGGLVAAAMRHSGLTDAADRRSIADPPEEVNPP